MAIAGTRRGASIARALLACIVGCATVTGAAVAPLDAQEFELSESMSETSELSESTTVEELPLLPESSLLDEQIPPGEEESSADAAARFTDPSAADFDQWLPIVDGEDSLDGPAKHEHLRPFDYFRHWGFHHSSTDGRFTDKNVPLHYSSWLNRPFHVDWFAGPLLSDMPNKTTLVKQTNTLFGGLRFGWDFDYYWGVEWRFGWGDPDIFIEGSSDRQPGQYWVSDVHIVYYPWGDTRVRPFFTYGLGISEIGSLHNDGGPLEVNLLGMPFGLGVQFKQTPWLAWRAEIMDNLAWGSEGISTTHNVSFTAGMELRYGARKPSYWPWRTARHSW